MAMKRLMITFMTLAMAVGHVCAQDFSDLKGKLLKDSAEYAELKPRAHRAYHARCHHPQCPAGAYGCRGLQVCIHGGELTLRGAAPYRWT